MDIKEFYPNVLRIDLFPDARLWANVGSKNDTSRNEPIKNLHDIYTRKAQLINFQVK